MNPSPRKANPRADRASAASPVAIKHTLLACVRGAGKILMQYFGQVINPRQKESQSSIVCDADLASERYVIEQIQSHFPDHSIIAEESGFTGRSGRYTWVIDPLDGTSNFVAGLPWFGAQIGVLDEGRPILAAMFLPVERRLYFAEAGQGAFRNNQPIRVTPETNTRNVLCAFGFDSPPERRSARTVDLLVRISRVVRNTRATNSLVDFCYTADGRLGACINLKTKIWDIVPIAVILPEAGGVLHILNGSPICFEVDARAPQREYAVLGANAALHRSILKVAQAQTTS